MISLLHYNQQRPTVFNYCRPCTLQRLSPMLKASCCFERPPNNITGHSTMEELPSCGVAVALSEGDN